MKVWINSSYTLFGQALEVLLASLPGITVQGASRSVSAFPSPQPEADSLLVLWLLPLPIDFEPLFTFFAQHPAQKVVCLASSWTPEQAREALQAGAAGCVDADITPEELALALRQAFRGEVALSSRLQRALILDWASQKELRESTYHALSPREQDVLIWVCQGLSNKKIAQQLYLSVRTVENHLSNIYAKLNVNSRTEAAVIAIQHGWVELPKP